MKWWIGLGFILLNACGTPKIAGAGIETSTVQASVTGNSIKQLATAKFYVLDQQGKAVDSVAIDSVGLLVFQASSTQSLELQDSGICYYANTILPTDTIRPSHPIRAWFAAYTSWDSLHLPSISTPSAKVLWDSTTHRAWVDSLPPGRHRITSPNGATQHWDLVLSELGARIESVQSAPKLSSPNIRPLQCGYSPWTEFPMQIANAGCAAIGADRSDGVGVSTASIVQWGPDLIARLNTLPYPDSTKAPHSKLTIEFSSTDTAFDVSSFDSLRVHMNLPVNATIMLIFEETTVNDSHWLWVGLTGRGSDWYSVSLNLADLHSPDSGRVPTWTDVKGLEFRNVVPNQNIKLQVDSLEWKKAGT